MQRLILKENFVVIYYTAKQEKILCNQRYKFTLTLLKSSRRTYRAYVNGNTATLSGLI